MCRESAQIRDQRQSCHLGLSRPGSMLVLSRPTTTGKVSIPFLGSPKCQTHWKIRYLFFIDLWDINQRFPLNITTSLSTRLLIGSYPPPPRQDPVWLCLRLSEILAWGSMPVRRVRCIVFFSLGVLVSLPTMLFSANFFTYLGGGSTSMSQFRVSSEFPFTR